MIASSCLATDLGMGFPFEHGLHATLIARRLADLLQVDNETATQTYYVCLLTYSGCTTDADIAIRIYGGDQREHITPVQFGSMPELLGGVIRALPPPSESQIGRIAQISRRLPQVARFIKPHFTALCDVAEMMAERLGLPTSIQEQFAYLTERWDGRGVLGRARGEEIPLPIRINSIARDAAYQQLVGGFDHAVEVVTERAGHAFDPEIAAAFAAEASSILALPEGSAWDPVLEAEPRPWLTLAEHQFDRGISGMGDFADLVSPYQVGHSERVAALAADAAERSGFDQTERRVVRRAAHLHDLGRVAIHPRIWQKPAPLSPAEWEHVRLHSYHTGRILSRSSVLQAFAGPASAHHERLDGSGYHREIGGAALSRTARLIAAADAFSAMTEPRPHRAALTPDQAADHLVSGAAAGKFDPDAVRAVVEAAGRPTPEVERPAGLTDRESEILGLVARGLQTKQIARRLDISTKTADGHIQHAYRKIGVSTRAAATLFAMEHGLVSREDLSS